MQIVLDESVLWQLGVDLEDSSYPARLAGLFLALLPGRVDRVQEACRRHDDKDALDAVLSLRTSSSTVGLVELAEQAGRVEQGLRHGDTSAQGAALGELPRVAERARGALAQLLGSRSAR